MAGGLELCFIGRIGYHEGRNIQQEFIERRQRGELRNTVIYCEHPPVVTLGKRTSPDEATAIKEVFHGSTVEVVPVTRGGKATYHGPGQLLIYPVIALGSIPIGVKNFVALGLGVLSAYLNELGITTEPSLSEPGVWLSKRGAARQKLAAVGLQIERGVTNHGFSLNVKCDLSHFRLFSPCGFSGENITSMEHEIAGDVVPELPEVAGEIHRRFEKQLFIGMGLSG